MRTFNCEKNIDWRSKNFNGTWRSDICSGLASSHSPYCSWFLSAHTYLTWQMAFARAFAVTLVTVVAAEVAATLATSLCKLNQQTNQYVSQDMQPNLIASLSLSLPQFVLLLLKLCSALVVRDLRLFVCFACGDMIFHKQRKQTNWPPGKASQSCQLSRSRLLSPFASLSLFPRLGKPDQGGQVGGDCADRPTGPR